ncbi:MAG: SDR family oxidoreductase, partial [Thermomicrobia bacterium]|nr:SDR family oxidoreductase [Thermomicrobia bacterium]
VDTPMADYIFERSPGAEEQITARHAVGRIGAPDEIAAAVLWLCSDAATFITGHPMVVDGGYLS